MTFEELALFFRRARDITLRDAMLIAASDLGENAVKIAQEAIGHDVPQGQSRDVGEYGSWAPLSPTWTIPEKIEKGFATPNPLQRDNKLRDSISFEVSAAGMHSYRVKIFSDCEYAGTQEYGEANPIAGRAPIPPRPFMRPAALIATATTTKLLNLDLALAIDSENPRIVRWRDKSKGSFLSTLLATRKSLKGRH